MDNIVLVVAAAAADAAVSLHCEGRFDDATALVVAAVAAAAAAAARHVRARK